MTNEHNGLMQAFMTQKRRFSCRKTPSDYCVSWRWHFQHWRWATLNGAVVRLWTASLCTAPAYWYRCAVERFTFPCLCLRSLFHKKMKNRGRPEKKPWFQQTSDLCLKTTESQANWRDVVSFSWLFLVFYFVWKQQSSARCCEQCETPQGCSALQR